MNKFLASAVVAGFALGATFASAAPLTLVAPVTVVNPTVIPAGPGGGQQFGQLTAWDGVDFVAVDREDALFKDANGVNQVVKGVTPVTTFDSTNAAEGGVKVKGVGTVKVTYLGREAGFSNDAGTSQVLLDGAALATDTSMFGDSFSFAFDTAGGDFLDFFFSTAGFGALRFANNNGPIDTPLLLSYTNVFNGVGNVKSIIAFFEDKGGNSIDIDDMVVRIDVIPVPLPAAAWMFLAALGGMGLLSRRRSVA